MTASRRMEVIEHSNELGGASVLVLNYGKDESTRYTPEFSAMFILPVNSSDVSMSSLISDLCSQPISDLLGKVRSIEVKLKLPRFKLNFGPSSLVASLKSMGMTDAFDNTKTGLFNQMTNDPRTYIEDILHGATMEVTEEGTVAAAGEAETFLATIVRAFSPLICFFSPFFFQLPELLYKQGALQYHLNLVSIVRL
jgi:serpin B